MSSAWSYLLCFAIVSLTIDTIDSCSCQPPEHPQQHYCAAHYVIVARIRGVKTDHMNNYYRIKVNKVFKANEKALAILGKKELVSAVSDSLCGVELEKGKTYILTGRVVDDKLRASVCYFHHEWSALTVKQKKAFKLLYSKGCNCKIESCHWWNSDCKYQQDGGCWWTTLHEGEFDCQMNESVCMKQGNGKCGWNMSFRYRKCLKQRQEDKERQRALEP